MNRIAAMVVAFLVVLATGVAGVGSATTSSAQNVTAGDRAVVSGEALVTNTTDNESAVNETGAADGNETETMAGNGTESANLNETETADVNGTVDSNVTVGPGARLAGVVGVQQAEVQGEVEHRAFGLSIAAARSNNSKVRVLANESERIRIRLQELENRTEMLNRSYRNGTIRTGTYHARLATISARIRTMERLANQTVDTAHGLPAHALEAHGVNVSDLERVRSHARNMSGAEVSAIAREMAGPHAGHPLGKTRGPPEERPGQGPPEGEHGGNERPGNNETRPGMNETRSGMNETRPGRNETRPGNQSHGPPTDAPEGNNGSQDGHNDASGKRTERPNGEPPGTNAGAATASEHRTAFHEVVGPITSIVRFVAGFAA